MPAYSLICAVKKYAAVLVALVGLTLSAACTIAPPSPPVQKQTFAHMPKLNWQAPPPEIIYAPGLASLRESDQNPRAIIENWVRDRLSYGGRFEAETSADAIKVIFRVIEADISETRSKVPGVLFDTEKVTLNGVLKVKAEIFRQNGISRETVIEARAVLNREGAISLNELDAGRFLVIQRLSADFDRRMEAYLRRQNIVF